MKYAPIVLFAYKRLDHLQRCIHALQSNYLSNESELYIYSDAPRSDNDACGVEKVRGFIKKIKGFKHITIIERETNYGLARSFIEGNTEILSRYERMIGLEDDNLTAPFFLKYMNDALELYKNEDEVICISGYCFPLKKSLPNTYFLRGADTWSYGTWRRGWALFNRDAESLLRQLKEKKMTKAFNINDSINYSKMLEDQIAGIIDSWGIRWYASAFLHGKLNLYPGKSLVQNIGHDGTGEHKDSLDAFKTELYSKVIEVKKIPIKESKEVLKLLQEFYNKLYDKHSFIFTCSAKIKSALYNIIKH